MPLDHPLESAQLYLHADADSAALDRALLTLPGRGGANLPGCYGAGDYSWDAAVDARQGAQPLASRLAQLRALPGIERVDLLHYAPIAGGLRAPELANGIKRTLFLRVQPDAPKAAVAALERDLLRMPDYLRGIRNWSLGRVISDSPWTHVWQQEFERVDDLLGEYMLHPYHWAWVDRWFDPEQRGQIVCRRLSHAFCAIDTSILASLPHPETTS